MLNADYHHYVIFIDNIKLDIHLCNNYCFVQYYMLFSTTPQMVVLPKTLKFLRRNAHKCVQCSL